MAVSVKTVLNACESYILTQKLRQLHEIVDETVSRTMVWLFGLLVLCVDLVRGQGGAADIEVLSHICKYGLHSGGKR